MVGDEENGFDRVEMCCLWGAAAFDAFAEGELGLMFVKGVDGDCVRGGNGGGRANGDEVVASWVEGQRFWGVVKGDLDGDAFSLLGRGRARPCYGGL